MMDQLALIIAKMSDQIISFFRFGSFEKDIFILLQIEIYVRIIDPSLFRTITSIIISTRLGLALYTTKKNEKDKQRITKTPSWLVYVALVFCNLNGSKMMELDSANLRIYPVSKYIRNNVH